MNLRKMYKTFKILLCIFVIPVNSFLSAQNRSNTLHNLNIDHVTIAVKNLEAAGDYFKSLGFTLKQGHLHPNSINNLHIKFKDGTEVELITASDPKDALAKEYLDLINQGNAGAFVALNSTEFDEISSILTEHLFPHNTSSNAVTGNITFPRNIPIRTFWFVDYLNPFVEQEKFVSHKNMVTGLEAIWLNGSIENDAGNLFSCFGYSVQKSKYPIENSSEIKLDRSSLYLTEVRSTVPSRNITGMTLVVSDIRVIESILIKNGFNFKTGSDTRGRSLLLAPEKIHGTWIEFLQKTEAQKK